MSGEGVRLCPVRGCHGTDGRPRLLRPAAVLCPACRQRATRALGALPTLYAALRARERPRRGEAERVTTTRTPPTPLDLHATHTATTIARTLGEWEEVARTLRTLPTPPNGQVREVYALGRSVRVLQGHEDVLYSHPYYGSDYAESLLVLLAGAWIALGWGGSRARLKQPCPRCGWLTLTHYSSYEDVTICGNCRTTWDEESYASLAAHLLHAPLRTGE